MEGGREGERNQVCQKKSGPKQLSHALATAAATKLVVQHREAEGAVGLLAGLGACLHCLCPLKLFFPSVFWGLWAGGGAQAPFSFSFCGSLPLKPALQRTATQMLPAELLNLESSQKGMSISRRFFFFKAEKELMVPCTALQLQ